jgi:predicted nuclease of predicted toxin-antitoxin system
MHGASDLSILGDILERARQENRVIVSADSDFGVILASQGVSAPDP